MTTTKQLIGNHKVSDKIESWFNEFLSPLRDDYENLCEYGTLDGEEVNFSEWLNCTSNSFEDWAEREGIRI